MMDIDPQEIRTNFEAWARGKGHPETEWPKLWEAYQQGIFDAPQLPPACDN